jgi:branched-chain amino acid transport system substrate-binding protein
MTRRLIAAAAVACAALGIAACGSDSSSSGGGGGDTVKIGTTISLSGAVPLTSQLDGYKLAVDDANAAGGIDVGGKKSKLELVTLDNRSDANLATQQLKTLVLKDNVAGVLGGCCQQNITGAAQADQLKVPDVMCCLPLELTPASKGYSFNAFQRLQDAATSFFKVADGAATNKKMVVVTNNDPSGPATAKLFGGVGGASGYSVVAKSAVPAGTTDFSDVVGKAKAAGAEVLVAAMVPPDCFAMWKQMKALKYAPKVAIGLQCAQTPGWAQLGKLGDGTLVVLSWTKTAGLPGTDHILDKLGKKWPNPTDIQGAASGYNAAQVLIDAIKRAGSTDRAKIAAALQKTNGSFALGDVKSDGNGKAPTPTFISQWGGGDTKQVYPAGSGSATLQSPPAGLN